MPVCVSSLAAFAAIPPPLRLKGCASTHDLNTSSNTSNQQVARAPQLPQLRRARPRWHLPHNRGKSSGTSCRLRPTGVVGPSVLSVPLSSPPPPYNLHPEMKAPAKSDQAPWAGRAPHSPSAESAAPSTSGWISSPPPPVRRPPRSDLSAFVPALLAWSRGLSPVCQRIRPLNPRQREPLRRTAWFHRPASAVRMRSSCCPASRPDADDQELISCERCKRKSTM